MKFRIEKEEIFTAVKRVQGIVGKPLSMPVLQNVAIKAEKNVVKFLATNLEMGLSGTYTATVESEGGILVPAKTLYEVIRELPGQENDVRVSVEDPLALVVKSGNASFKLVGLDITEYPALPVVNNAEQVLIDSNLLIEIIERTLYAAAKDDGRIALTGLLLELVADNNGLSLTAVATDGHRLSLLSRTLTGQKLKANRSIIIPGKYLAEILRIFDGVEGTVALSITESHVVFAKDNLTVYIRLLDDKYPNYRHVIPTDNNLIGKVDRQALLKATKRVSILSDVRFKSVLLTFSKNLLSISTKNIDGGEASECINADHDNKEFKIAFNAGYLVDALASIKGEEVAFTANSPEYPCLLIGEDSSHTCIVMPLRISQ